ncbi:uncharacterized protein LOC124275889 isoform X2 [Haliotis rubra]|uniref:uncharacterized protein LOC124275889 isoform X2 n=1 Tax=Haliotis rubra TaxID=36100 RepID=UPI001EE55134|nr:uncharacterized protein LOC124275889 isoform X2 [Haliotis rubra]
MSSSRARYRLTLNNMIHKAKRDMFKQVTSVFPILMPVHWANTPSIQSLAMQDFRYRHEFVEICRLGKGGFGSVFKLLREVKALAGLTHSNIVGYNAAWLEHGSPQTSSDTSHTSDDSSSSTDSASFGHQGNSASVSIVFGSTNTGDDLDDRQGPKILELDPNSGNRAQHRINIQISLYTSSITFQVVECVPTTEKCEQFLHCHQSIDTWSCRAKPQHRHW